MTLDGKVALITGGARGMGRVSAIALAQMGARVIIVDWEGEAGTRARDYINHITGRQAADFVYCDLSSLQAVRALADDVKARYPALQILMCNAGITDPVRRLSVDGFEMHLATCHLAHFLLTHLLLDLLKLSAPARIVSISSEAHKAGPGLDFDDLPQPHRHLPVGLPAGLRAGLPAAAEHLGKGRADSYLCRIVSGNRGRQWQVLCLLQGSARLAAGPGRRDSTQTLGVDGGRDGSWRIGENEKRTSPGDETMRCVKPIALTVVLALGGGSAIAQTAADGPRATFDAEICQIDGLTPAQCDCAWKFVSGKLSAADLKLAMLLTASSSEDPETARKADQALDKHNASDKRRDAISSESSALVIEAEDACMQ